MKKSKVLEGMHNRYATKKFDSVQKLSDQQVNEILEIIRLSPSSINAQPWHFTIISNKELKAKLAKHSYINEDKIVECSHLIVFEVESNMKQFTKRLEKDLPKPAFDYFKNMVIPLGEETIKKWMIHQIYLSMGIALNACASLDVDACPMEGINREEYAKVLNLKETYPVVGLALGIRHDTDYNQPHLNPKSRKEWSDLFDIRD